MNEMQARQEICRLGRSLFDRGYAHSTAGNISMCLDDGFLISPTNACLGFLEENAITKVSVAGDHISGDRASKTLSLHLQIYQANQNAGQKIQCIIHTHSTHLVALSLQASKLVGLPGWTELLEPITPYFVMKVGHTPLLDYDYPGSPQVAELAAKAICTYAKRGLALHALMLSRLGPVVWHESPAQAMATLEELEETAKLKLLFPQVTALTHEELQQLYQQFQVVW